MPKWFAEAFGVAFDEAASIVSQGRDALVTEAWFGRRVPESHHTSDLGWIHDAEPKSPAPSPDHEQERGIDR